MKTIDLNALASVLKSIIDYYFEMNKINLMIDYFLREQNRKEIRSLLKNPQYRELLNNLLEETVQKKYEVSFYSHSSHKLKKQFKQIFTGNVRRDFFYFQSSSLFLTNVISSLFTIESFWDKSLNVGTSIFEVVLMYYVVFPFLFKFADSIINDYIEQKIDSCGKALRSISGLELAHRYVKLVRDDYKFLFERINEIRDTKKVYPSLTFFCIKTEPDVNKASIPVPSLKFLTSFYIKNNTDLDIKSAPIPEETKEYINSIKEIEEWEGLTAQNWSSFY